MSEGSQISENTGFLAMDGNDIKTKLCGKGTKKISFTINLLRNRASIYATIDVSGAINGSNVILNGTFTYIYHYRSVSTDEDDRDSTGPESHTVKNFVAGNGNSQFFSKSGEYYEGHTSYEWGNKLSSAKPQYKPSFTLSYEGRSFTIPNTAPWTSLGSGQWSHSGTF